MQRTAQSTGQFLTAIVMIAAIAFTACSAHAAIITSVADGDWNTTNTWDALTVPTSNDGVAVHGHAVTIDPGVSPTPGAAQSVTVSKALNIGSVEVLGGQSLATDAISVESQECKFKGAGDVLIGPLKDLQVSLWLWADITARIIDNPADASAVTIATHRNEVNWSGSHTYSGGTTINGGEQLNAQNVNCFGTGPVTVNDGTRLAHMSGQTNYLTIAKGSLTDGTWNGPITLQGITEVGYHGEDVYLNGDIDGAGGINVTAIRAELSGTNTYSGGTTITSGMLVLNGTNALSAGALVINSGGLAALNYSGNRVVASLTINGVLQDPGTYGSTSSPAANKNDSYFAGTGTVGAYVPPVPPKRPTGVVIDIK